MQKSKRQSAIKIHILKLPQSFSKLPTQNHQIPHPKPADRIRLTIISNYSLINYQFQLYRSMTQLTDMQEQKTKPPASKQSLVCPRRPKSKNELISELRNEVRWNLSSKKYSREHLEAVFQQLNRPSELAFLWLHWNRIENICQKVVLPAYSNLKIMNLGGNSIISIEPLQHADMPALEQLWLWSNLLTRVDSLRKMHVPNLRYIDLSSNKIYEWNRFSELHSKKLELINLQNNGFACIDGFAKMIGGSSAKKIVNFLDNQLVRVFGKLCKKGKKNGKNYHYPTQKQTSTKTILGTDLCMHYQLQQHFIITSFYSSLQIYQHPWLERL